MWDVLREWYRGLRQRFSFRPRDLTPADIVPPGAQPICPACVLPHHPAASRCQNCGEIVSRYATSMAYVWILVWGPRLQRVVRQSRLSRVLWVGLLVSAVGFVSEAALMWWWESGLLLEGLPIGWIVFAVVLELGVFWIYLAAGCKMLEAVIAKWDTWRDWQMADDVLGE